MNRYRGRIYTKFGEKIIERDTVALGDTLEDARKKMIIELYNSFKYDKRNVEYKLLSVVEDTTPKPTFEFVKTHLLILNDTAKSIDEHKTSKHELYKSFRTYSPEWDDDELSDILSYCEEGELADKCKRIEEHLHTDGLAYLINGLLDELDNEWICHYDPFKPLEEQYEDAIKGVKSS